MAALVKPDCFLWQHSYPVYPHVDEIREQWKHWREQVEDPSWLVDGCWPQRASNQFVMHALFYLRTLLCGFRSLATPIEPLRISNAEHEALQRLRACVTNMAACSTSYDPNDFKIARARWNEQHENEVFPRSLTWEYAMDTASFATQIARYLANLGVINNCWITPQECAAILAGMQFGTRTKIKSVLLEVRRTFNCNMDVVKAEMETHINQWLETPNKFDVDKLERMRESLKLCDSLALSVMSHKNLKEPVTSVRLYAAYHELLKVVARGVVLTQETTRAIVERVRIDTFTRTLEGDTVKATLLIQVRILTALLPYCTRMAVCLGTDQDRKRVQGIYDRLSDNIVVKFFKYDTVGDALNAYRQRVAYGFVNMAPMAFPDEDHTAVMLEIVCSLHHCASVKDDSLCEWLKQLTVDVCGKVTYPERRVSRCDVVLRSNELVVPLHKDCTDHHFCNDDQATAVTCTIFHHALVCLQQIEAVSHPPLLAAFKKLRAYARTL